VKLWLVRHAATQAPPGLCYGALDLDADPQATRTAARLLLDQLPRKAALWCSPQRRCRQMAEALARGGLASPCHWDARLAEMNFGAWEGRTWDDLGEAAITDWTADFAHHRPGGGESVSAFMARVAQAFDEARDHLAASGGAMQDLVWVTHAGVIRAAGLLAAGHRTVRRADQWPREAAPLGGCTCLTLPGP
jgi:alpha-ribazole phosphatase